MEIVKIIGPIILAFIMFSLGIGLRLADFKRVILQPKDFFVGFVCQVVFLPLIALILVFLFPIQPELKVGLIILALAPGGVTTNIISKFARGDVALSISLTALISLLSFLTIPYLFVLLYGIVFEQHMPFEFSIGKIVFEIFLITTVPVILGMILKSMFPNFFSKNENVFIKISFLFFFIFLFVAIYQERYEIFNYFKISGLIALCLNLSILIVSYFMCRIFNINKASGRTIVIESSLQNGTLAIVVGSLIFDQGIYLVPIAAYALIMYIVIIAYIGLLGIFNQKPSN